MAQRGRKAQYDNAPKPDPRVMDGSGAWTMLTPQLAGRLVDELSVGDWPAMVAYRCGCSPSTLEVWITKGADPLGVEPYVSFADAFLRKEADLSARLMTIIMDRALGRVGCNEDGSPRTGDDPQPDVGLCKWILLNRFQFLWRVDRVLGKAGGVSVAELVERRMVAGMGDRADKVKRILAQLPAEAKADARKEGFLLQ